MANKYHPYDRYQLQAKPIHFFKIIVPRSLQEEKLMIPRTFVKKYGEGLPKTVLLKLPNGAEWKVNLVKCDGEIWFRQGWKEFAEYHSLAEGHLLVFRYEGTSHFQVHIFDMSALEIDYPSNLPKEALHHTGRKCEEGGSGTTSKKITALDRASSFKSRNPFFLLVMQPSYINCRASLNVPLKFAKSHFDLSKKRENINLSVPRGRVWPARYLIRKTKTRPRIEISRGWNAFAKDNNLKVGDVCIFELTGRTEITFQVFIFRETDNSNCPISQESAQTSAACQGQRKGLKIKTTTTKSASH